MKEKKARVEDAMHATKAAVEEGIVPGGGVALLRCAQDAEEDQATGRPCSSASTSCCEALEMPLKQIAANAGYEGAIVVERIRGSRNKNFGFDALNEKYTDMITAGIIDPTKVVRIALQNASSVAGLLLTTQGLVAEIKEEKEPHSPAMPPGGGGMY